MKKILVCLLLVSSFGWAQGSGQFSGGGGKGNGTVSGQANGVIPLGTTATSITQQSHCNDGVTTSGTVTCSEPFNATSLSAGTAPTACGSATACFAGTEASTAGTPTTGQSYMRFSSTAHNLLFSFNNGAEGALNVASGGTGVATLTGPIKGNGTSAMSAAVANDIVGLFSTCSGTQYLGADGACHTAGGGDAYSAFNFNLTSGNWSVGTNHYFPLVGTQADPGTPQGAATVIGKTGTLQNFYFNLNTAVPASCTYTLTVFWCTGAGCTPAATTITCAIAAAGFACNDTTHTQAVTAGDLMSLREVSTSGGSCTPASTGVSSVIHVN